MKTIQLENCRILVVEDIPEEATEFELEDDGLYYNFNHKAFFELLPPGNWQILGLSNSITEEQAKGIVEIKEHHGYMPIYRDYEKEGQITKGNGFTSEIVGYDNALQSFHSLLASHSITELAEKLVLIDMKNKKGKYHLLDKLPKIKKVTKYASRSIKTKVIRKWKDKN